jgi:2-polyprenyl-3-methyl-5-hydroxy-6-metoxy-1,4-benzoquinol methylase
MQKQVDKKHYDFLKYNLIPRWNSYYYQITEILKLKPKEVLEVGGGSNLLRNVLEDNQIDYYSCDIAEDLNPDYLQSIDSMKINKKFDVVCAFQVLEHLPFKKFEQSLINLKNHSKKYVLISIPDRRIKIYGKLKIPKLKEIKIVIKLPFHRKMVFDGEHYWEYEGKGTLRKNVLNKIKRHFKILKEYSIPENPYHRMFVLKKLKEIQNEQ